ALEGAFCCFSDYLSARIRKPITRRLSMLFAREGGKASACPSSSEIGIRNKGIVPPLHPRGRKRPVPWHEGHVIAQRPEALADGLNERAVIAARKIRTVDRALKENIAHNRKARRLMEEHHMAGRVAGAVAHIKREAGTLHRIAVFQPAVWQKRPDCAEAIFRGLIRQGFNQEQVFLMRSLDRNAKFLREIARRCGMIEMPMRKQNSLDGNASLLGSLPDARQIAARIADGAAHIFIVPDERAVLLKRGNGKNRGLESHRDESINCECLCG